MHTQLETHNIELDKMFKLGKGKTYSISPSQGWLGIEDGVVEIQGVYTYEDAVALSKVTPGGLPDIEGIVELDPDTVFEYWVVYKYRYSSENRDSTFCLSADIFVSHISMH